MYKDNDQSYEHSSHNKLPITMVKVEDRDGDRVGDATPIYHR